MKVSLLIMYRRAPASTARHTVHATPTHTNVATHMKTASGRALIMCSDQVPKLIPFRRAQVKWYGRAPEAAAPRVSSSMLLDGCVDQRVEACEAEVEYVHEAGEVSRSTDSRTTSLYRRSVLSPAPAGSSTCLQDGFKRLEKEACEVMRVLHVRRS